MTNELKNKINLTFNSVRKGMNYLICKKFDTYIEKRLTDFDLDWLRYGTDKQLNCLEFQDREYYILELPTYKELDCKLLGKRFVRLLIDDRFTDEEVQGHILPGLSSWTREVIIL